MGFSKEEKSRRIWRGFKTVFFLITMAISFMVFSAPVFFVIADTILPSALLSASLSKPPSLSLQTLSSHFNNYDLRYSLIDIPLVSIFRSAVIICVYTFCDGPKLSSGLYLGITTICSVSSLVFVSMKASFVFSSSIPREGSAMEAALFVCSLALAIAHIFVAYRTSCRERRKLLIYKIDIEAISACKNGFPMYQKILQEERVKYYTNNKPRMNFTSRLSFWLIIMFFYAKFQIPVKFLVCR